mgnify:CR=1 FL=1
MTRIGRLALALPLLVVTFGASLAADSSSHAQDEDAIWKLEQSIYAGRSGGTLSSYLASTDPDYAGWPPQASAPMGYAQLAAQAEKARGLSGEELSMKKNLIRVHRDGNVALAYYTTHRTKRGGGARSAASATGLGDLSPTSVTRRLARTARVASRSPAAWTTSSTTAS